MRATGYIPDPPTLRRPQYRASRAGLSSLPSSASLLSFAPPVLDQGPTGSCVGHATAAAIYTSFAAQGNPLPWVPSPDGIYRLARALDRLSLHTPLRDEGSMPSVAMRGISEWGIRPMQAPTRDGRYSDCEPASVNDEPHLAELEEDALHLIVGEYAIYSRGEERITDVCTALAAGHPVTCSIAGGSDRFQGYSSGILGPLYSPLDHYVWLAGYDGSAFIGRNSWAKGWGEDGNFRLSEAAVQELGDLVVLDVRFA